MQKRKNLFVTMMLLGVVLGGCAGSNQRINARQIEMDNMKRQIKFLQDQNSQLTREMQSMKKQLTDAESIAKQVRAEMATKIDELTQQLDVIQNSLKDANQRMSNLSHRPPTIPSATSVQTDDDMTEKDISVSTTTESTPAIQELELYNMARKDLNRGNYQLALQGFQQFVAQYPNTDLTDNAQYWIGEVYYAQGRYQDAIQEFEKVIRLFNGADKTPSALLKIGFSYISLEEEEQAKIYLEEVITKHPNSDEASLARGRLSTLN